jgi:hypothetical protein
VAQGVGPNPSTAKNNNNNVISEISQQFLEYVFESQTYGLPSSFELVTLVSDFFLGS